MSNVTESVKLTEARLLLETSRYNDAESVLQQILTTNPEDATAHALLSLSLLYQDKTGNALQTARAAVGLAPDIAHNHYVHALALRAEHQYKAALDAIRDALRLNPESPQFYALQASIHMRQKAWQQALQTAETGLQIDSEHDACANVYAMALVKVGKHKKADQILSAALARNPENAVTHANQGWALLHKGEYEQGFVHFREALRLNPASGWAREGILEAMKARNVLYHLLLRYFLWMSRLTEDEQWEIRGGLYAVRQILRAAAQAFFPVYLILLPFNLFIFTLVVLTWTAQPLFALLLRFDHLGRLSLPKEEITASNWVALCLVTAGSGVFLGVLFQEWAFLVLVLGALAMIVPVAGVFHADPGPGRIILTVYSALLTLGGLSAFLLTLTGKPLGIGVAVIPAGLFLSGWLAFSWTATLVIHLTRDES
jgi:tetratricopeptide (TPR) repeat protein